MTLMTNAESKSALDIAVSMSEFYKKSHPEQSLPVLEHKNGSKDKPLLELLVARLREKSTQQLGQETLEEQKDTVFLDKIEQTQERQLREITNQREGNDNTQSM